MDTAFIQKMRDQPAGASEFKGYNDANSFETWMAKNSEIKLLAE